jgi:outer membrane protein assembly factor BamB
MAKRSAELLKGTLDLVLVVTRMAVPAARERGKPGPPTRELLALGWKRYWQPAKGLARITNGGALWLGCLLLTLTTVSATDHWPGFRGQRAGVADDNPALPETWSETENVAWKVAIPGLGWSSPIVWGDHVFVTTAISSGEEPAPLKGLFDPIGDHSRSRSAAEHRWVVVDLDFATGKVRWERELHRAPPPTAKQMKNSYATETPVTDGERVYVYFGAIGLVAALDFNGQLLWRKDVGAIEGLQAWGTAQSPLVHKDRLYIVNDNRKASFIAAFETKTGAEIWRTGREEVENWSSPIVWEHGQRTEIVTAGEGKVRAYSMDGSVLWELQGMSRSTIPTPLAAHGMVYVSSGYPGSPLRPVYAIRPGATGDISLKPGETSNAFIAWSHPRLGTYNTSALVYGDYLYTLLDRGLLLCHDARTGKQVYGRQRVSTDASGFTASPWAYNGKVFAISEDGDTFVMQAGPSFKPLGKNSLNGMVLATPAVARDSLFIRTSTSLYRIAKRVRR